MVKEWENPRVGFVNDIVDKKFLGPGARCTSCLHIQTLLTYKVTFTELNDQIKMEYSFYVEISHY